MSRENSRTIETYNSAIEKYIEGTPQEVTGGQKEWIDSSFEGIAKSARVLELGSGFGRDAQYLMSLGYSVETTDATEGFVDYLNANGLPSRKLNIITDTPDGSYGAIYASAVFLHFTDDDFSRAVRNVRSALGEGGRFIFSLKRGSGSEWSTQKVGGERFFRYYEGPEELEKVLGPLGMRVVDARVMIEGKWIGAVSERVD